MQVDKDLLFIRHGLSTKNQAAEEYKDRTGIKDWNHPDTIKNIVHNPIYIDAHLSPTGQQQCLEARERLKDYHPDLILCSPLQRALETCRLIFEGREVPRMVEPLISQTFKHTSQICRSISEKKKQFPEFDFSRVDAEGQFWFIKNDSSENQVRYFQFLKEVEGEFYPEKAKRISEFMMKEKIRESSENVRERSKKVKEILKEYKKSYKKICIVSHFYTIRFMCCKQFDENNEPLDKLCMMNCDTIEASLEEISQYE